MSAAPTPGLFRDNADAVTLDFASRLETELQPLDRETRGRLVVALFPSPEGNAEEFVSRIAAGWEREEPKLQNGAILFYFTKAEQVRVWTGEGLARRLSPGDLAGTVREAFRGPGAFITYPESIENCALRLSAQIRSALDEPPAGARLARLRWKAVGRFRLVRAIAGAEFPFLLVGALLALVVGLRILWAWYRDVGETIAAGKRRHETRGRIALDVAENAGIGAAKVAAALAIEAVGDAIGGSSGGGGGELSGAGGSFGGGGASGSW